MSKAGRRKGLVSHATLGRLGPPETLDDALRRRAYPTTYGLDGSVVLHIDGEDVMVAPPFAEQEVARRARHA